MRVVDVEQSRAATVVSTVPVETKTLLLIAEDITYILLQEGIKRKAAWVDNRSVIPLTRRTARWVLVGMRVAAIPEVVAVDTMAEEGVQMANPQEVDLVIPLAMILPIRLDIGQVAVDMLT